MPLKVIEGNQNEKTQKKIKNNISIQINERANQLEREEKQKEEIMFNKMTDLSNKSKMF